MTSKHYDKVKNQIGNKPGKMAKLEKHNKPKSRNYGRSVKKCIFTGTTRGVIRKYGLNICRRYFRLNAKKLGFRRFD